MVRTSIALAVILDGCAQMGTRGAVGDGNMISTEGPHKVCFDLGKDLVRMIIGNMSREAYKKDLIGLYVAGTSGAEDLSVEVSRPHIVGKCDRDAFICPDTHDAFKEISGLQICSVRDALHVALTDLVAAVGSKKYEKRIIFITNCLGVQLDKSIDDIALALIDEKIWLDVVIISPKSTSKAEHCQSLDTYSKFFSRFNFRVFTLESMQKALIKARRGSSGQTVSFMGELRITDDLRFHVQMFNKIGVAKSPSVKSASKSCVSGMGDSIMHDFSVGTTQRDMRHMASDDIDKEIEPQNEVDGYRFGRECIPFEHQDMSMRVHYVKKGIVCLGFISSSMVPLYLSMGHCGVLEAYPGLKQSQTGFSAFVRAMAKLDKVLIARVVVRDGGKVTIAALFPSSAQKCVPDHLYAFRLPFWDDIRHSAIEDFSSERYKPTSKQIDAMHKLISSMSTYQHEDSQNDLDKEEIKLNQPEIGVDSLEAEAEDFTPETTLNPFLERLYGFIDLKARYPGADLKTDPSYIQKWSMPCLKLLECAKPAAQFVREEFFPEHCQAEKTSRELKREFACIEVETEHSSKHLRRID